jgi:hypothetical protein
MATLTIPTAGPRSAAQLAGDINGVVANLATMLQGAIAPTAVSAGLASLAGIWWHDTANAQIKVRNQADTAWITIGTLDETNNLFLPPTTLSVQNFTSIGAQTWSKPNTGSMALIQLWSAGGSGNRQSNSANGIGGNGGGYAAVLVPFAALSATETVTIGAGGSAVTGSNGNGVTGGNSSVTIAGATGITVSGGGGGGSVTGGGALIALAAAARLLQFETGALGGVAITPAPAGSVIQAGGGGAANGAAASTPLWLGSGAGGAYAGATGGAGVAPAGGGASGTSTSGVGGNGKAIITCW